MWSAILSPVFAGFYSNVLLNGGFEAGASHTNITDWSRFGNSYRYAYASAHEGSYALLAYGNWWPDNPPDWNGTGVYQDQPAREGEIWEGTVWARSDTCVTGRFFGELQMSFFNAASQAIYEVRSARQLVNGSPSGTWTQLTARAKAVRSTAYVRMRPIVVQSPDFESSSVWFDDAALYRRPDSTLRFAGREWVYIDGYYNPGPNFFSTNSAFLDESGRLHLKLQWLDGKWHCAFIESPEPLGFGEYRWHLNNRVDRLDTNLILGLFTYALESVLKTNQNEVDIELSHAFPGMQTNMLLYSIQPYTIGGNSTPFLYPQTNDLTTHRFVWRPDQVLFESYHGHSPTARQTNDLLASHVFRGRGIPIETNEKVCMNLWLFFTNAPANTQEVEVVISDFVFVPFNGFILLDEFEDGQKSNVWDVAGPAGAVQETNGCLVISPPSNGEPAGYLTHDTIHRNERGTRYVFSAQWTSVTVSRACSGEDVCALLYLSTEQDSVRAANSAVALEGRYDADSDTLAVVLLAKTNAPGADGIVRFEGVLDSAASKIHAPGGLGFQLALDPQAYEVSVSGPDGQCLALQTNQGCSIGLHQFGELLDYAYWFVGAQNGGLGATGTVVWSRTVVGVRAQEQDMAIEELAYAGGQLQVKFPGAFQAPYGVYASTSAPDRGYVCIQSNRTVSSPVEQVNIVPTNPDTMFYRIGE
ncbi:MAG TPA: hypothetical protein DCZ95_12005 [Verrucomicrobia bacterium]|nr:MAG: hypothetical protein A2X46_14055 [Lentisphaerae bacterium GWF2_57_35]HBA84808.1 hypothetical protein [Verrucomicrobiota bacterium]